MTSAAYTVILVDSVSHAIRIEKLLAGSNITCKLVPVPRHLSSDCGVCVRMDKENRYVVEKLLIANQIRIQSIKDLL